MMMGHADAREVGTRVKNAELARPSQLRYPDLSHTMGKLRSILYDPGDTKGKDGSGFAKSICIIVIVVMPTE